MSTAEQGGFYKSFSAASLLFLSPVGVTRLDGYFRGNNK